jgi:hypothetical protein
MSSKDKLHSAGETEVVVAMGDTRPATGLASPAAGGTPVVFKVTILLRSVP